MSILISELVFIKKKWEIMENCIFVCLNQPKNGFYEKKIPKKISNFVKFLAIIVTFHNFSFLFYKNKLRYQNGHMFS